MTKEEIINILSRNFTRGDIQKAATEIMQLAQSTPQPEQKAEINFNDPEFHPVNPQGPPPKEKEAGDIAVLVNGLKRADQFISNGIEFGYIKMPDGGLNDPATETPNLIKSLIQDYANPQDPN